MRAEAAVAHLASGTATLGDREHPISPGDPRYAAALAVAMESAKYQLRMAEEEEAAYQRLVQHWRVRELPREGEFDKGWFVRGQKSEE